MFVSLIAVGMLCACHDDELTADNFNPTAVTQADDFTDPRDGHVYKCIKIGNQVWMAENLDYYMEGGSSVGCYVYNEETFKAGALPLTSEEWNTLACQVADETADPSNPYSSYGSYLLNGMMYGNAPVGSWDDYNALEQMMGGDISFFFGPNFKSEMNSRITIAEEEKGEREGKKLAKEQSEKTDKENGGYSSEYGYLYTFEAAQAAVPEGWRLPTDADWKKLEAALGMQQDEIDKDNTWRGINAGEYLKQGGASGFNALFAGFNAYVPNTNSMNYIKKLEGAYFWTADSREIDISTTDDEATRAASDGDSSENTGLVKVAKYRILTIFSPQIWRGDTRIENGYRSVAMSVRCVRDN